MLFQKASLKNTQKTMYTLYAQGVKKHIFPESVGFLRFRVAVDAVGGIGAPKSVALRNAPVPHPICELCFFFPESDSFRQSGFFWILKGFSFPKENPLSVPFKRS